jgi:hypothetical protein
MLVAVRAAFWGSVIAPSPVQLRLSANTENNILSFPYRLNKIDAFTC